MRKKPTYEELERKIKELEESEKKYRQLFDTSMVGIYRSRIDDGKILAANQTSAKLMGFDSVDQFVKEYVASEHYTDPNRRQELLDQIRSQGRVDGFEIELTRPVGSPITMEISAAAYPELGYIEGIAVDVSARKQVEETLRKSEEKFRFLAEKMADIVWTLDMNFKTTYVSPSIENVLGFKPEERKQQTLEEMITPESLQKVQATFLEELRKDEEATADPDRSIKIEIEYYHKDGYTVWMENIVKGIRDPGGAIVGMHGVSRDITERKQTEETLRESESRYSALFTGITDAVYVHHVKEDGSPGQIIDANHVACKMLGYSRDELLGMEIGDIDATDSTVDVHQVLEDIKTGRSVLFEQVHVAKNGKRIPVEIHAQSFEYKGRLAILSTARNITDRKRAEEERMTLVTQLQQARKMESVGILAGGIAHDFNNILGIIIGNTEIALDDVPEWNPVRLNLEEVRTASLRAKDVVRQLLSFARKTKLEKKPINITPIVKESLKLLRSSIPTSVEIHQNISKYVDTILADPTQIHQVLINLCTNACHAMPDGGIIEIHLKNMELKENSTTQHPDIHPGQYVNLTVIDTGHGISQKDMDRIYDPYFTTKEVGKGAGMGLAVVHGIVQEHNGIIAVGSELGKGTRFNIFFPVVQSKAMVEVESKTDEILPGGDERILFIDDEASIVNLARQMLERLGYGVETQMSPMEALELFRSKPDQFDLVITDLTMPKMTGDRLIKEILNIRADIPVILCTGFNEKIDETKARGLGAAGYIEKPVTKHNLASIIRGVLDRKKA